MSDYRTDVVGGPAGWSPFAINSKWDTVEGVRRLVLANTRLEIENRELQHSINYLTNADGLPAELRRLREQNVALKKSVDRLLWLRGGKE